MHLYRLRGFFFLILMFSIGITMAQKPRLVLPVGHSSYVETAVFSSDGKYFLTKAVSNTFLKLWDVTTGKLLGTFTGHTNWIHSAGFSPDGRYVLSTSSDSTVRIWETKTTKPVHVLRGHRAKVQEFAFSKDGKLLYSGAEDSTIKTWDFATGKLLNSVPVEYRVYSMYLDNAVTKIATPDNGSGVVVRDLRSFKKLFSLAHDPYTFIYKLSFSSNDAYIATASSDGNAMLWNGKDGKHLHTVKHSEGVTDVAFTKDASYFITTSYDKTAKIWDTKTGKLVRTLAGHKDQVHFLSVSPNGKLVATASRDNSVKVWDIKTGALVYNLARREDIIYFAAFDPSGKYLVTGEGTTPLVWDLRSGKLLYQLSNRSSAASIVKFSPDGTSLAIVADDSTAKIFNTNTGRLTNVLAGHRDLISDLDFSSDGKYIATSSADITAKIWDAKSGNIVHPILRHRGTVTSAVFSNDGKKLLTATTGYKGKDCIAKIWNADSATAILDLTGHTDWVRHACFNANDSLIATRSMDSTVKLWDFKNRKFLYSLQEETFVLGKSFSQFSSNNKFLLTFPNNNQTNAKVWNLATGKLKYLLPHPGAITSARISSNSNYIVTTTSYIQNAYLWDATTGKLRFTLNGHLGNVVDAVFSNDNSKVATLSADGTAKVWSTATGKMIFDLKGHTDEVSAATFNSEGTRLVTVSDDNTNKVWDMKTGKEIYTFIAIDSADYFVQIPQGYYMASPNAVKQLHYTTSNLKVITFQQLDVRFNRPDKVLEAIGCTDKDLINSYRKAYNKRIKKLGIDTTSFNDAFSVPEADFANRDAIAYEQTGNQLKLSIKGMDKDYKLDRLNVWVNEVPLFGLKGISIRTRNSNAVDTNIIIQLSKGENIIETSVSNVNGTESFRMPLQVKYGEEDTRQQKVYFVGIGINEFKEPENNLQWSVKDIKDLAAKLKSRYGNRLLTDTLFDANVSKENILSVKKKLQSLSVDDKVIVSYSGHGVLSKELDYYLSTYTINFQQPELTGLSYDDMESLLDNIPSRKKLMLIDACHSGEIDKDEVARIEAAKKSLDTSGVTIKSRVVVKQKNNIGTLNSFELMKDLFVNVGKGTGATIISAAGGMQYAQERGDLKNGVFTYSIIDAFNHNKVLTVSQLRNIVGESVTRLTNGLQKPTSRNETNMYDWVIW